jgi:hypothetical protein
MKLMFKLLKRNHEAAARKLARWVARDLPVGTPVIFKNRGGRTPCVIHAAPRWWSAPSRLTVKTDRRGTVLSAEYEDLEKRR